MSLTNVAGGSYGTSACRSVWRVGFVSLNCDCIDASELLERVRRTSPEDARVCFWRGSLAGWIMPQTLGLWMEVRQIQCWHLVASGLPAALWLLRPGSCARGTSHGGLWGWVWRFAARSPASWVKVSQKGALCIWVTAVSQPREMGICRSVEWLQGLSHLHLPDSRGSWLCDGFLRGF